MQQSVHRSFFPGRVVGAWLPSCCAALLATGAMLVQQAKAPSPWPARPVRIVVTFLPGGSNDIVARLLSSQMAERVGAANPAVVRLALAPRLQGTHAAAIEARTAALVAGDCVFAAVYNGAEFTARGVPA